MLVAAVVTHPGLCLTCFRPPGPVRFGAACNLPSCHVGYKSSGSAQLGLLVLQGNVHAQLQQWRLIVEEKEQRLAHQAAATGRLESDLRLQQAKHESSLAELNLKHDAVGGGPVEVFAIVAVGCKDG